MSKYKYYFKKPKSEIAKDILKWLALAGAVYIAASSPYFTIYLMRGLTKKKYPRKKVYDTFYNLKKQGCINIEKKKHRVYITLTEKGKRKAGRLQIDSLVIRRPKKWDGKWRLVIFDIAQLRILQRNAFREKLKELGFRSLQKSVLVCPYPCKDEVEILREFFGLNKTEVRLIIAEHIEDDNFLRRIYKL